MEDFQKQDKVAYPESLRNKIVAMENILKTDGLFRSKNPYTKIKECMDAGLELTRAMRIKVDSLSNVEFLSNYKK